VPILAVIVGLAFQITTFAKHSRQSDTLNTPVFGTHDWITYKGYVLAGVRRSSVTT
jgi:hypothetical protein